MKRRKNQKRVQRTIFIGIGYPLLVAAALGTLMPLLWLFSSSFKTANEIFSVPIHWFPKLPPRITASPYIATRTYPPIQKPSSVDPDVWPKLKPPLEKVIWNKVQKYITDKLPLTPAQLKQDLQTELTEGIWKQHVATFPTDVWNGTTASIVAEIEKVILPETVQTIWDSVYRQVHLGAIEIEDIAFNRYSIDSVKWAQASETSPNIRVSPHPSSRSSLSYHHLKGNKVQLETVLTTHLPMNTIRGILLPVRGDASYHHLSLNVSVNGTTYQSKRPYVLNTALPENTMWRLHGTPGELESSHIPMRPMDTQTASKTKDTTLNDAPPQADTETRLLLQLTIHRPSYLATVWDKLTTNYRHLWKTVPYHRYFLNSVFIATASTLLTLFFCSLGGYAFAKYQFKGKKILWAILLASMMVPFQVLLVPLFGWMSYIGWLNSYKAIIIPFSVGAFGVFLMRQFIVTLPTELIDAARIDGCSEFGIYARIVLPIIKPALGALTLYAFLSSWNGYLWPLIVLRDEAKYTLPIGLANLVGVYRQDYGMLMAGTLLSLLPIVIFFLAMQREFVQGMTLGSVKE